MHILIVDDDTTLHRPLMRGIKAAGYTTARGHRISCATSGDACREVVDREGPVDVIFMDGELGPGVTGPEVVSRLRGAGCGAKIVMMSSNPDMNHAGIMAGADAVCDKTDFAVDPQSTFATLGIPPP